MTVLLLLSELETGCITGILSWNLSEKENLLWDIFLIADMRKPALVGVIQPANLSHADLNELVKIAHDEATYICCEILFIPVPRTDISSYDHLVHLRLEQSGTATKSERSVVIGSNHKYHLRTHAPAVHLIYHLGKDALIGDSATRKFLTELAASHWNAIQLTKGVISKTAPLKIRIRSGKMVQK